MKYLFVAGGLAFLVRGFLLIPVPITGNSMTPTLSQGDMVIIEKITKINRFDVIVFQSIDGNMYVKRVIGLPGETIDYREGKLYVDGKYMEEPFLPETKITNSFEFIELMGVEKLGKASYFVLGDNRPLSKDSRSFGAVSEEDILGKAQFLYYPFNHWKIL